MSIDGLCGDNGITVASEDEFALATFSAGCTIRYVQESLCVRVSSSLASAIMSHRSRLLATSLHGSTRQRPLATTSWAACCSGQWHHPRGYLKTTSLAWVGSTGELGVVVEVTMYVVPTMRVMCETRRSSLEDAMEALQNTDHTMAVVDTIIGADTGPGPFAIRTCHDTNSSETGEPIVVDSIPDGTVGLLYETYGLSLLRLASQFSWVRGPIVGGFLLSQPEAPHMENAIDASMRSAKGTYNVYHTRSSRVPIGTAGHAHCHAQRGGAARTRLHPCHQSGSRKSIMAYVVFHSVVHNQS